MIPFRSLFPIALVLATAGISGCKEDPPAPTPEPASSAASPNKGKLNMRNPMAPLAKVDPQTMKEYRSDVCYFGTLTLKQARDSYLASLGKDEPSEKKIPSFGGAAATTPPGAAPPPGMGKDGKPAAPGKDAPKDGAKPSGKEAPKTAAGPKDAAKPGAPEAKPTSGPDAAKPGGEDRKPPFNFAARAPHERNARACTVAAGLKEPAMPEVDGALAAFAPFAVELAKNIAAAQNYYMREEYKKDSFEKGKELHKKLVADFAKLDELSDKRGEAVMAWHKAHPADLATAEDGQKAALPAFEDARNLMLSLIGKKIDPEAMKAALKKLEGSSEALKTFGTTHQSDPWPKIMSPSFDAFIRAVKEGEAKITDKGVDPDTLLPIITTFTSLVEAKHRALSRALIAKGQTAAPLRPAVQPPASAAPGTAAPAPEEKPAHE